MAEPAQGPSSWSNVEGCARIKHMFFSTFEFRKPCTRTSAAGSIEQVPSINSILVYKGKAGKKETPYCLDLEAAKAELLLLEAAQVKDLKMELAEMAAAAAADTGSQNLKELQATVAKFRLAASAAGVHVGDKAANAGWCKTQA